MRSERRDYKIPGFVLGVLIGAVSGEALLGAGVGTVTGELINVFVDRINAKGRYRVVNSVLKRLN